MSDPFAERPIPRAALLGAAALVTGAILFAAAGRFVEIGTLRNEPEATVVTSLDVRFADGADGSVLAIDPATDTLIHVFEPGGGDGFVRGVLRGLFRTRMLHEVGVDAAFRLEKRANGHLALIDPTTDQEINLGAFGPDNARAFAQLLVPEGGESRE